MTLPTLIIQPDTSTAPGQYRYKLQGIIDVDAVPSLTPLYDLPPQAQVELDFAAVQRVNSMGLAQMLKLFEHWQDREIGIRVSHANRMTMMLFKMTGLDRFLGAPSAPSTPAAKPQAAAALEQHRVELRGILDIDAVAILEPLYNLPAGIDVELDFAEVQRVNSMGLAQLLKLFEHWQAQHTRIRVSHANRMIMMLFKMTGLDRFLVTETAQQPALAVNADTVPVSRPVAPKTTSAPVPTRFSAPPPQDTTPPGTQPLNWQVHMQSNQQLNGWYFLNTHMQRRLNIAVRLDIVDTLIGKRDQAGVLPDIAFVKPFDAVPLIAHHGFLPLARPTDQSDEVTILARADDSRSNLAEFAGGKIAATSPDNFVYLLGRYLLDESGLASEEMGYLFAGHEIKAVQMLLKGDADLLFMHSASYQRLSGMTRRMVKALDHSEAQFAFHLWCLAPRHAELVEPLREFLLGMDRDGPGRQVLAELGCTAWVEPEPADIEMLERIFDLYAGTV